jgi:hypothetical protein
MTIIPFTSTGATLQMAGGKGANLVRLTRAEHRNWQALSAERRAVYERELRRRQVPRVLISDGRSFYEGVGAETDTGDVITGSPVSPGVVEGLVHVVLNPAHGKGHLQIDKAAVTDVCCVWPKRNQGRGLWPE